MPTAPTRAIQRVPNRSAITPNASPAIAAETAIMVYPREASPRVQPNSTLSGLMNTATEGKPPKARTDSRKVTETITQP